MSGAVFTSVRTEGGLLPTDLLRRVSLLDSELPGMTPADYELAPGERLADAIVRSWNRLLPIWERFADRLEKLPSSETTAETQTRGEWLTFLIQELGFGKPESARPIVIEEKEYPISHRGSGVALHLVGARLDLDHRPQMGGRAPHSMVQELLNRDDGHLWALLTNGLKVRLLRDSSALTRQAFCEFDVEAIFAGQLYSDFALLWLTCHATRFTNPTPPTCWLQQWSDTAQTEGVRALDSLRSGVEQAIESLGSGLLTTSNTVLRERLRSGELSQEEFQHQLLRLVYRLLFLLVAESRELLAAPGSTLEQVERYRSSYSIERLVALSRRQRGSLHGDLWVGLQVTFRALAGPGAPPLGLVGLGSFLWSPSSMPDLLSAAVPNRALLDAIEHLTSFEVDGVRRRVDYKNLGSEELGGVYESLLELHAQVNLDDQTVTLQSAAGNERKTTGSYYTPTPLIRVLLDSALDPVLDEAEQADDPETALLDLKVIDPAVGSGHFLIAAANRIAHRLASVRAGETEPSPTELRTALHDVIRRCVYGIDVNPLSVELCKVSLWMEATEPGKPLSFLDHRIVLGNSLLGTTPALIEAGLPDDAFKTLTGDDKAVVTTLKKRNKQERDKGQMGFVFGSEASSDAKALAEALASIDDIPEFDVSAIEDKERRFEKLRDSEAAARLRFSADLWCAAFVNEKVKGAPQITTDTVRKAQKNLAQVPDDVQELVEELTNQYGFLHLHVAFPDVFRVPADGELPENEAQGWSGGFDVVLGNPPWERVKLQEKEWFAVRDPDIAAAPNAAARKKMIKALVEERPSLYAEFVRDARKAEGESHLLRQSSRFPLAGRGDVNTYAVFAELMRNAIRATGRVGVIVPTGVATDDTLKFFFGDLVDRRSLVSLYDFENRKKVFPGIDSRIKFCLLTLTGADRPAADAEFVFFALEVDDLEDHERQFTLTPEDFELLNPNTKTCPVFRSKRDAEITKAIYRRVPVLVKEGDPEGNPWGVSFQRMFDMSNDSALFRTREQLEYDGWTLEGNHFVRGESRYLPLYEAKMVSFFDHRAADVVLSETAVARQAQQSYLDEVAHSDPQRMAIPRAWVADGDVVAAGGSLDAAQVGLCDVTSATNWRTFVSTVCPPAGFGNNIPVIETKVDAVGRALLNGALSSYVQDFSARQKVGGLHLNFFIVNQLAVPSPAQMSAHREFLMPILLELAYTSWDLVGFAEAFVCAMPPFVWDPNRRRLLEAELNACMFRVYGVGRGDVDYILDTFPIVRRKDETEFGEYRTKRLVLERFDAMADARAKGVEYETILDPPPADPSLCHPESSRPSWAAKGTG